MHKIALIFRVRAGADQVRRNGALRAV